MSEEKDQIAIRKNARLHNHHHLFLDVLFIVIRVDMIKDRYDKRLKMSRNFSKGDISGAG